MISPVPDTMLSDDDLPIDLTSRNAPWRYYDQAEQNSRDSSSMPDSPSDAVTTVTSSNISPVTSVPPVSLINRPNSAVSLTGMNGNHSPHNGMNGRTPSPPSMGNSTSSQQLPPACGARQLSKLKRFLTTLQQFGSDISPEIGDRVRTLVLGLVNSHLSIEEFHAKLQEATNFPLRPFVIPFLKANLPLLQRELLHCARMAKQTPQQYLAHNEHILFDTSHTPVESQEILGSELNENGKRPSPDRPKDSERDSHMDVLHPAKRHHSMSPGSNNRISPTAPGNFNNYGPIRLEDISLTRELRERERMERERLERERMERERERHYSSSSSYNNYPRDTPFDHLDRSDDEWKQVENMLHCIMGMVDKTKRALAVLQERSNRDREELAVWMRRHSEGLDHDMKKRTSEMMVSSLRQTEDRVSEVKRRAEEAVNEVKRQAVCELQKAVAAAEQKANELVSAEKLKMERSLADIRKTTREEVLNMVNSQEESSESCWNCGRKANETCSGCNVARYCGSFCQHKDWENHHRVCGQQTQVTREAQAAAVTAAANQQPGAATAPRTSPPPQVSSQVDRSSNTPPISSPANSVTSVASASKSGSRSNSPSSKSNS
ncbi:protein CBFA2T1-like isoform X3 [Lineus longissimus]|uniref:protein CBFA2T1-like isoform X3 n=1 Tax=Lineus longissimus TaxID=88925 RepID=UPI00315C8BFC